MEYVPLVLAGLLADALDLVEELLSRRVLGLFVGSEETNDLFALKLLDDRIVL